MPQVRAEVKEMTASRPNLQTLSPEPSEPYTFGKQELGVCKCKEQLQQEHGVVPGIAMILVGERQDSKSYVPHPVLFRSLMVLL